MYVHYDEQDRILFVSSGDPIVDGSGLPDDFGVLVGVGTDGGRDIVSVEVLSGTAYLPLGRGYDGDRDILTLGQTTDDPARISTNGDFIGYWEEDDDPEFQIPIGVALRNASVHLAPVLAAFPRSYFPPRAGREET